jgi:hypothetical protein
MTKIELDRKGYLAFQRNSFAEAPSRAFFRNDAEHVDAERGVLTDALFTLDNVTLQFSSEKREDIYTSIVLGYEDLETLAKKAGYVITRETRQRRPRLTEVERARRMEEDARRRAEREARRNPQMPGTPGNPAIPQNTLETNPPGRRPGRPKGSKNKNSLGTAA